MNFLEIIFDNSLAIVEMRSPLYNFVTCGSFHG